MTKRKPLFILISDHQADQIHFAMMAASAAAAIDRPVTLFFAKGAVNTVVVDGWKKIKDRHGMTGPRMDHRLAARGVADMPVMMDACMAMNVRFLVCENSLKEEGLISDDLIERPVVMISSMATILDEGENCDWLKF